MRNVLLDSKPGNIVIFHDAGGSDRSQTVKAIEPILMALHKNGYEFVTVSELLSRARSSMPGIK
ncbi:hypothetical protein [Bacillus sp. FJAT-27225]|uniref:hypothetical protein n=1 Tax=Bacillus sp. FJAT-27225 TaxID=1743144 RepID=UPI0011124726|nr:hypothetical protein [Bacillus sp. FJAT-27225]